MNLAGFWFLLTIPFGPGEPVPATLEGSIYFSVFTDTRAIATPFGYTYDRYFKLLPMFHQEELIHIEQMEALGPLFPTLYLIDSEIFEPYHKEPLPHRHRTFRSWAMDLEHYDINRMWRAPPELHRKFPQFRYTFGEGFQLLPGWLDMF